MLEKGKPRRLAGDAVMVCCSWDSGPFSTFSESDASEPSIDGPGRFGTNTVLVPKSVWERYLSAQAELSEAEDALGDAEEAFLREARKSDPRWASRG